MCAVRFLSAVLFKVAVMECCAQPNNQRYSSAQNVSSVEKVYATLGLYYLFLNDLLIQSKCI